MGRVDRVEISGGSDRTSDTLAVEVADRADELLERVEPLARLTEMWARTRATGQGFPVVVTGEAGVGKTSLVDQFVYEQAQGAAVLRGDCEPFFTPRPLGPFVDMAHAVDGPALEALSGAQPDQAAHVVLHAVRRISPCVLIVEDIHWADEATLDVLRLLTRHISADPALLIMTFRDDELDRAHPIQMLMGDIGRRLTRIRLAPLSDVAVTILAERAGFDGAAVYRSTSGNPFFVSEVLASMDPSAVPATVRDAVLARVGRLEPAARRVVEAVAIVPPRVEPWLLEAMMPGASAQVAACLASGVVHQSDGSLSFRHELARVAVEETLDLGTRRSLHQVVLAALSQPPDGVVDPARLAHHARAADDGEAVLEYAPVAAVRAAEVGSHAESLTLYASALPYSTHLGAIERGQLFERHATEALLANDLAAALASQQKAEAIYDESGEVLQQCGALLRLAYTQRLILNPSAAADSIQRATVLLDNLSAGPEVARLYAAMAWNAMCVGDAEQTFTAGRRAIELAENIGDAENLAQVMVTVGTMEMDSPLTSAHGEQRIRRAIALGLEKGLGDVVGRGYNNLSFMLQCNHQLQAARQAAQDSLEHSEQWGLEFWRQAAIILIAEVDSLRGDWDLALDGCAVLLRGKPSAYARVSAFIIVGLIRARRGDPDVWGPLDDAHALARSTGEDQTQCQVTCARAEAAWLEGRGDEILDELESAYGRVQAQDDHRSREVSGYWLWKLGGRPPVALDVSPSPIDDQMAGRSRIAADRWAAAEHPYHAALALSESEAEEDMKQAVVQFQDLGAAAAAGLVVRRLRERGARNIPRGPRASTRANVAGLTRRELDVLTLLAEGLRNVDIANRLYLSERTAEHHVASILRKLDAQSRRQAVETGNRLGLLSASAP
jgi:DNA-binding NarL/FixJ family response regulator